MNLWVIRYTRNNSQILTYLMKKDHIYSIYQRIVKHLSQFWVYFMLRGAAHAN